MTAAPDVVSIASWNADLTSHAERAPLRGETLQGHGFSVGPGGKGSNASVAAARQGARVTIVARTGQDDFGRMGLDLWQREGIDTRAVVQDEREASGLRTVHGEQRAWLELSAGCDGVVYVEREDPHRTAGLYGD